MQSIFRLPWCSDQIAPKMQTGKMALDSRRTSPVVEIPVLSKFKRKRTESPEHVTQIRLQSPKKQRVQGDAPSAVARVPVKCERETAVVQDFASGCDAGVPRPEPRHEHPVIHMGDATKSSHDADTASLLDAASKSINFQTSEQAMVHDAATLKADSAALDVASDLTPLQQVIENEFNMQILMKHNELRLIEQELAKCQVALEQLRRCELLPFPGADRPEMSVSSGTGPAISPRHDYTRPLYAAPHGVTDGPYTSHYRQWLLRDSQFDSAPAFAASVTGTPIHPDARSMRHASAGRKSLPKAHPAMHSIVEAPKLQPVYPAPTRKYKLAIVKRSTDGQLVKLVCNHCHRHDFSNSQGFLNHCRIAHKIEYKSHDHAAIDCGQPLDEHELASVPPEAHTAPPTKPSASRSTPVSSTPFKQQTFVHPLNTTIGAFANSSSPTTTLPRRVPAKPVPSNLPASNVPTPFQPATQAPRLSAQFAKYSMGGNLEAAITSAREKVDLGAEEELSPSVADSASPLTPATAGMRSVFGIPRAGSLAPPGGVPRPPSRKGYRQPASRPRPSPLVHGSAKHEQQDTAEILESPQDRSLNFSPNTVDGNPGLVSDHEDDDHGSASEDEVPQTAIAHSLGVRGRDCTDSMDIDVSVDDDIEEHGVIIRRNSMLAAEEQRGLRTGGSASKKV